MHVSRMTIITPQLFGIGRWPQGEHPYGHSDPDWWLGWMLFPARWLLSDEAISIDLWGVATPAPLSIVLRRADAIRPLLDEQKRLGLVRALDDIYEATG